MGIISCQTILDAIVRLTNGTSKKTDGKITAVNLAKEAGVSKATLYRCFEHHAGIRENYEALRRNGIRLSDCEPITDEHSYHLLKDELRQLRTELTNIKITSDKINKLKAHQILILWMDNERLQNDLDRLQIKKVSNI